MPRVHCPEERSKAKEVENCRYTSVPMVIRLGRQRDGRGDGVPKAGPKQAAVDSRGSRTLRVCKHLSWGDCTRREGKDELTSCRGIVQSAWQKPPVRRKGGRAGLPKTGKWPPRCTGTTVLTYPGSAPM